VEAVFSSGRIPIVLGVVALALVVGPAAAQAATITPDINTDEDTPNASCSLREAVTAANTDGNYNGCVAVGTMVDENADTIVLQSGMTYLLSLTSSSGGENANANGDLDVLTEPITIQASGAARATIDANGDGLGGDPATTDDRVLDLAPNGATLSSVTLTGLVITDGANNGDGQGGAGVREGSNVSSLSITGSKVFDNHASFGGVAAGLRLDGTGTTTITNSTIDSNTATGATPVGGIFANAGTLNVTGSTISNNHSAGAGGGLDVGSSATATLKNTTVSGNKANTDGGGIESAGTLTLANATIEENGADDDTDGSGDGGGIDVATGSTTVRNSIFGDNADNGGTNVYNDCAGTLASQGYNLIEDGGTGCLGTVGTDRVSMGSAGVGQLLDNGGPTFTHAVLGPFSLNAGNPATPGTGGTACEATDQRGLPRGGAAGQCDIGAFERQGSPASPAPPSGGSTGGGTTTPGPTGPTGLRAAALKKCKKKHGRARANCKKRANKLPL
jgi:CSLREA domain-containing protein